MSSTENAGPASDPHLRASGIRQERLRAARLYFVSDRAPGGRPLAEVLEPALRGGVDVFQLRDKGATDAELLAEARAARALCDEHGALFVVNDDPALAVAAGADGVHVGQGDGSIGAARAIVGADRLVGRSTHRPADLASSGGADYVAAGPVHETPTKPGRPAVGLEYVHHVARHASVPWFAIGGLDEDNVAEVAAAGATRIVVVRAIADAADPERAARRLLAALGEGEGLRGAA